MDLERKHVIGAKRRTLVLYEEVRTCMRAVVRCAAGVTYGFKVGVVLIPGMGPEALIVCIMSVVFAYSELT